jgi:hypothetical protein
MNQVFTYKVTLKPTASFSERESKINSEILAIESTLRSRGFYPLSHEVRNKTSSNATIVVTYRIQ